MIECLLNFFFSSLQRSALSKELRDRSDQCRDPLKIGLQLQEISFCCCKTHWWRTQKNLGKAAAEARVRLTLTRSDLS